MRFILSLLKKGYLLFLVSFIFFSCSSKMAPEGHFQQTPVVADGSTDDWKLPLRFTNEKYTFQYNVTNDDKNIYICVLSRDPATQTRILRSGMSIYFDTKGKKNKNISISFPFRKQSGQDYRNRNGNPVYNTSINSRKEEWLLQSDYYSTGGFINIENGQFDIADKNSPIHIAMKLNNNDSILVYEVVVPVKNIFGADLNPKSTQKDFSVGLVLSAVSGQGGGNGYHARPSMGMGGMGMHGGMGMGMGGAHGYHSSGNSQGAKEEETWYTFRLVAK